MITLLFDIIRQCFVKSSSHMDKTTLPFDMIRQCLDRLGYNNISFRHNKTEIRHINTTAHNIRQLWRSILLHTELTALKSNKNCINLFPNKSMVSSVCSISLLKPLWEKEKLLIMGNFSFYHPVS